MHRQCATAPVIPLRAAAGMAPARAQLARLPKRSSTTGSCMRHSWVLHFIARQWIRVSCSRGVSALLARVLAHFVPLVRVVGRRGKCNAGLFTRRSLSVCGLYEHSTVVALSRYRSRHRMLWGYMSLEQWVQACEVSSRTLVTL